MSIKMIDEVTERKHDVWCSEINVKNERRAAKALLKKIQESKGEIMRHYYEATEILSEGSEINPDFIRIDITDMLEMERVEVLQLIKDQFAGLTYRLILHHCAHDTGGQCAIEILS